MHISACWCCCCCTSQLTKSAKEQIPCTLTITLAHNHTRTHMNRIESNRTQPNRRVLLHSELGQAFSFSMWEFASLSASTTALFIFVHETRFKSPLRDIWCRINCWISSILSNACSKSFRFDLIQFSIRIHCVWVRKKKPKFPKIFSVKKRLNNSKILILRDCDGTFRI